MFRHRRSEKVCKWYFQCGDRITPCVSADAWATVESPSGRQPSMGSSGQVAVDGQDDGHARRD